MNVTERALLLDRQYTTALHGVPYYGTLLECVDFVCLVYGRPSAKVRLTEQEGIISVRTPTNLVLARITPSKGLG